MPRIWKVGQFQPKLLFLQEKSEWFRMGPVDPRDVDGHREAKDRKVAGTRVPGWGYGLSVILGYRPQASFAGAGRTCTDAHTGQSRPIA